ncbi:1-pyrroline-5-carboxylate dehydrogenase [Vibrio sp. SCSIO 43136]|uniref:1-pyrroline-5-carboxylate dehydrogenase n=1 Tax=Vibrio sp. SCSIO 43136 TaxID=2819101 RepID=UPI002075F409|nr:1-pyrroline-5-carboxylate dehydrogenase [Vibrio sp. SCSIO 43136]USD67458.1 1-pyrroline-5-carboxylate dehydrogenase [Vibrio sp. SCSIO 43136]
MPHLATCFSDAYSAWENWNLTQFDDRRDAVSSLKNELTPELAKVMTFHLEQAQSLIGEVHLMPGPTGETNELYTAGRGVSLLIQDDNSAPARQALLAQMTTAMLAGNSVVICSDDTELVEALEPNLSILPLNVLQLQPHEASSQILECDIRSLGYVGTKEGARNLNQQLANRSGAIVPLISEYDLVMMPTAHDPNLSLRFITERTRTINITAVGGNATLLELGSDTH